MQHVTSSFLLFLRCCLVSPILLPYCAQKPTVDTVKYQVIRLMRMLVGICQTLEQVPQEVR